MSETLFQEMRRYLRFGPEDEALLRRLHAQVKLHLPAVAEELYQRLDEHPQARAVLVATQDARKLKQTLTDWLDTLLRGPWDEAYAERRARIGRVHVRIGLPQRYMFGVVNVMRVALDRLARDLKLTDLEASRLALAKVLDLELTMMLESFREASLAELQEIEQLEKGALERRLALSEARYEEIIENGVALIVTGDAEGRINLFNRRCQEVSGLDSRRARGRLWVDLFVPKEDREALGAILRSVLAGERMPAYEAPVHVAEIEGRTSRSRRIHWHFTTLPGAEGPTWCAIGIDVTEERTLAARALMVEKLAGLGTMAAGLAHEIRNPLNAAHLQLTLVQRRLRRRSGPDVQGAQEAAEIATNEMRRLAGLVEDFLQFARPQPLRLARADLRQTAETIISLMRPEAATQGVEVALAPGEPVLAELDDEKMKQVILNLVRNGLEATGRGGRVRVFLGRQGGAAVLEVEDDGRGLPVPDAPIFEPFYTTKPNGTGLGLAIVHRIVSDHGGKIDVQSRPGRTVFSVSLPFA